jgi:hypothetical protein
MNNMDEGLKELFQALIEGQARTDRSVGALAGLIGESHGILETAILNGNKLFEASNARFEASTARLEAAHLKTEELVQKYVEAADARMKRIEENLDGLIRAISSEHSNGKSH